MSCHHLTIISLDNNNYSEYTVLRLVFPVRIGRFSIPRLPPGEYAKMHETAEPIASIDAVGFFPTNRQSTSSATELLTATASSALNGIIPVAALLTINVAIYAGMVSLTIRPNVGARMLPIGLLYMAGVVVGGAAFPRLAEWAGKTVPRFRRTALTAWPLAALIPVLFGFHHYDFNKPLRYTANFTLGMALASSYYLYFSRLRPAWRGTCFAACTAVGILVWSILTYLARVWPQGENAGFHTFLPHVYYIHATAIAVFAALGIFALVRGNAPPALPKDYRDLAADADNRLARVRALALVALAAYLLNGVLDVRLSPPIPASPRPVLHFILGCTVAAAVLFAGWLIDKRRDLLLHRLLPVCCGLFILAPSLAALGHGHEMHSLLHPLTSASLFIIFVVSIVSLAGMATDAGKATWYACLVYTLPFVSIIVHVLWRRVFDFSVGITVLSATALAFLLNILIRRKDFATAILGEPAARAEIPSSSIPDTPGQSDGEMGTIEAFLAASALSVREKEVAACWLKGMSNREISLELGISENTVKTHVRNILAKLAVANRTELLVKIVEGKDTLVR